MPFVFLIVGLGFLVVAVRGTQKDAFALLQSEFSGPNSFVRWALAIFILGALGYIPVIKPVTRALLVLVLLVIILTNGKGLFAQFNTQVRNPVAPSSATTSGTSSASVSGLAALPALAALPPLQSQAGNSQSFVGDLFNPTGQIGSNPAGSTAGGNYIDVFGAH
jgi:hypothetical protein